MSEENKKEELSNQVKTASESLSTSAVTDAAETAKNTVNNAAQNVSGQIAGAVTGGMESLTQKYDAFKGELTEAKDTVEGLLSGDTTSLKNMASDMVNKALGNLLGKLGPKVEISFSEPDSSGVVTPLASTVGVDQTAADTIQGVLSIITGLGVGGGNLQNIISDASPSGLLDAGKNLAAGKIGAFNGADAIKGLANNAVKSVTDKITTEVTAGFNNGLKNLNKTVNQFKVDPTTGAVTNAVTQIVSSTDDSAEFNTMMNNMNSSIDSDLPDFISSADEITQDLEGAKTDLENLSGGKDGAEVLNAVQTKSAKTSAYSKSVQQYESLVKTRVSGNSETGVIQGLSTNTLTDLRQKVKAFAPSITEENIDKVISLSQGDAADESKAAEILKKASNKTYGEIINFLKTIDSTITASTRPQVNKVIFSDPYIIGSYQKAWDGGKNNPDFPYISSVEELQAEIQFISREIESVIVHWSETHTDKNLGSEEINDYHLELGMNGIGYHYVIRRDGSLQRGRPVNIAGEHTPGYDEISLGVVFVGGINAPSGTPNSQNFLSSQSLTRSQINTFDHFCRAMYNVKPGILFYGHSDLDVTGDNIDPGFDVPDYVLTRFGKKNEQGDP